MGTRARSSRSSADQAYRQLRDLIVEGRISPGRRLTETEVARRLGLSRTPVRAALQRLHQEGYVEASSEGRRSRLTVAPLTRQDARELLYLVGLVEGMAARAAAELDVAARERLAERMRAANAELAGTAVDEHPDREAFFNLDHGFHQCYVEAGAGPRVRRLHDSIKPQAARYIRLYVSAHAYEIDTSVTEHRTIIDAIASGATERAEEEVNRNWRNAEERLRADIEAVGERGRW